MYRKYPGVLNSVGVAFVFLVSIGENRVLGEEGFNIFQAYLAALEPIASYDVIVHDNRKNKIGKDVFYSERHFRIVKSSNDQWGVRALINYEKFKEKPDLENLQLGPLISQTVTIEYFHSGAMLVNDIGRNQQYDPQIRDFFEFENRILEVELWFASVGIREKGMDRAAYFDHLIREYQSMTPARIVGDVAYIDSSSHESVPHISVLAMDRKTRTPISVSIRNNPKYDGRFPHFNQKEFRKSDEYEHKLVSGIPLPSKMISKARWEEDINGELVRSEAEGEMTFTWLEVNEALQFPDVEKIGSSYKNLYDFVFEDQR